MNETENPLESLRYAVAFSSMDWSTEKRNAWIYGIICGWDNDCFAEFNKKFGWSRETFDRLTRLHERFASMEGVKIDE
jgi:hypothetical protein